MSTLDFEIAGLRLRIETESARLADRIAHRFASYEAAPSGRPADAVLELRDMGPDWRSAREYRPTYPEADMSYADGRYEFWRPEFEGNVVLGEPIAGTFDVMAEKDSFETPVRLVTTLVGSKRDTMLLHASGALFEKRAMVFTARSGGGKTTLLSLLPQQVPLSDEIVALTWREAEGWVALSTPFTGGPSPAHRASGPLAAICFLSRAAQNHARPADRRSALRRVLRNTLAYVADPSTADGLLGTASRLCESATLLELEFEKSATISGYLQALTVRMT